MAHIFVFLVYSIPIVQILYTVVCNTCTCTDMFTVTTTKDQSRGIYNN